MKKTIIILIVFVVVVAGVLIYKNQKTEIVEQENVTTTTGTSTVPTLMATYISPVDWPPIARIVDQKYSCTEAGNETVQGGKSVKTTISGKEWCRTISSEGAAGSVYKQYAYTTEDQGKTLAVTFSLREVQCANYDEPAKSTCETERASFNSDTLISQVDLNVVRQQIKNADMMKTATTTEITTQSGVAYYAGAKGYFVRPKAPGSYPGIVMIHENRGLRPEIRDTAETLAKQGYMVLAVDLLGGTAEDQEGARALTSKFNQTTGTANMKAAAAYLRKQGATKIASIGWCFGGKQSVELAISGETLDATVVYYGGGMATTTDKLKAIKWPVLGIFGDKDQAIPIATVRAFEQSLNTLGIKNEIYIYPGVGHAFANPSGMNYAPKETMDAWNKTLAFLDKNLKGK